MRPLFISLMSLAFALDGNVKETVQMPSVTTPQYNASSNPTEIPCATVETMANSSFGNWKKVWRINETEAFDPTRITFINNYAIMRFDSVFPKDEGEYQCCVHAYAYEDFICFSTQISVSEEVIQEGSISEPSENNETTKAAEIINTTTPVPSTPAWFVTLADGGELFAEDGNMYFIRLFINNATVVQCSLDSAPLNVTYNARLNDDLLADLIIKSYNSTSDEGTYICNATLTDGNITDTDTAQFTITTSSEPNNMAIAIDEELADKYRNSAANFGIAFIMFSVYLRIELGRF